MSGHGSPAPDDQAGHPARRVGIRNAHITTAQGKTSTLGAITGFGVEHIESQGGVVRPMTSAEISRHQSFVDSMNREKRSLDYSRYGPDEEDY